MAIVVAANNADVAMMAGFVITNQPICNGDCDVDVTRQRTDSDPVIHRMSYEIWSVWFGRRI